MKIHLTKIAPKRSFTAAWISRSGKGTRWTLKEKLSLILQRKNLQVLYILIYFLFWMKKLTNPQMSLLFCIHENHKAFFRISLQRSLLGIRMKKWSHWRSSLRHKDTDYRCMVWLLRLRLLKKILWSGKFKRIF